MIKKITDVVGGALNAINPSTIKANALRRQSDKDFKVLKTANSYKGAPEYNNDGTVSEAGQARSLALDVKKRLTNK